MHYCLWEVTTQIFVRSNKVVGCVFHSFVQLVMTQSVVQSSVGEIVLCLAVQLVTTQGVVSSYVMSSFRSCNQVSGLGLKPLHDILGREVLKRGDLAPVIAFVIWFTIVCVVGCEMWIWPLGLV